MDRLKTGIVLRIAGEIFAFLSVMVFPYQLYLIAELFDSYLPWDEFVKEHLTEVLLTMSLPIISAVLLVLSKFFVRGELSPTSSLFQTRWGRFWVGFYKNLHPFAVLIVYITVGNLVSLLFPIWVALNLYYDFTHGNTEKVGFEVLYFIYFFASVVATFLVVKPLVEFEVSPEEEERNRRVMERVERILMGFFLLFGAVIKILALSIVAIGAGFSSRR